MDVDDIDRRVLAALLADGRADPAEVGDVADVGPTTASWRQATLEAEGVIESYRPRIDYGALGYLTAALWVDTDAAAHEAIVADLADDDRLVTVYELSGSHDVLAIGHFVDSAGLDGLLGTLRGDAQVRQVRVDPVTQVKHEQVPPGV